MSLRLTLFLLALAGTVLMPPLADAQQGGGGPPRGTPVQVDAVRPAASERTAPILGRLAPLRSGDVAARVSGPVADILVEVGERVRSGDVVAVIDSERLFHERAEAEATLNQRSAALAETVAQRELARVELRRLEGLRGSSAFSQARFDESRQSLARWDAASRAAEATESMAVTQLARADASLRDAAVLAPYGGVITRRHTERGAYISTGQPVVSLVDDMALEIEAEVPSAWAAALLPGTPVAAQLDGPSGPVDLTATLRAVVPEENPRTRTRVARFALDLPQDLPPGTLAANQSVTLLVPQGVQAAVSVHKDAVVADGVRHIVFVARNGTAERREVVLGPAVEDRFSVVSGLQAGDLAVVRGNERLTDGQAVLVPAPTPPTQ